MKHYSRMGYCSGESTGIVLTSPERFTVSKQRLSLKREKGVRIASYMIGPEFSGFGRARKFMVHHYREITDRTTDSRVFLVDRNNTQPIREINIGKIGTGNFIQSCR